VRDGQFYRGLVQAAGEPQPGSLRGLGQALTGLLASDGEGVYDLRVHARQTCLAHLIRRARGLSVRMDPELAWFGLRVLAVW
jgi:hypothetical protein